MRRPSAALASCPPASPRALTFLLLTVFIDILGLGLVVPIAPHLVASLGGGSVYFGVLVVAYGLLHWLTTPLLGALSDRYGRRPILLVSLTMLGLDYLAAALTPTLWLLLVTRAVAGATAATYTVVSAYVADVTPPGDRTRAYGLVSAAGTLGFIALCWPPAASAPWPGRLSNPGCRVWSVTGHRGLSMPHCSVRTISPRWSFRSRSRRCSPGRPGSAGPVWCLSARRGPPSRASRRSPGPVGHRSRGIRSPPATS